jgi:hypothetical protein
MSVDALWAELVGAPNGWQQLSKWRADAKPEGLHLDFKEAAFVNDGGHGNQRRD